MTTILKIPKMSQEFLTNLAGQVARNDVFYTNTAEGINNSFGMLLMFLGDGMTDEELKDKYESIGGMWEFLSQAQERSVNGWPMFFSGHIVHKLDTKNLYEEIRRISIATGIDMEGWDDGNLTTGDTPEARDDDTGGSDEVHGTECGLLDHISPQHEEHP